MYNILKGKSPQFEVSRNELPSQTHAKLDVLIYPIRLKVNPLGTEMVSFLSLYT